MISIDTKLMRDLVAAANTANTNITTAMELLTSISSHQDWACKEKDAINDYSTNNKNKIRALHQDSQAFLQTISSVAEEFETTENSISDMFSGVESLLAGIMSVTSGIASTILGPGGQLGSIKDIISEPTHTGNNHPVPGMRKLWDVISPLPHTGYNHPQSSIGDIAGDLWGKAVNAVSGAGNTINQMWENAHNPDLGFGGQATRTWADNKPGNIVENVLEPELGFGGQAPRPWADNMPGNIVENVLQPELGFGGQAPTPWADNMASSGIRINENGTAVYNMPGSKMDGMPVPELLLSQETYTDGPLQDGSSVIQNIFNKLDDLPRLPDITPIETFSFKNLIQPLSLCSFKDIDLT